MKNNQLYNAPEDLLFGFCYDFLAKAHEIFKQHCFENDFVNRCIDRYTDEIGQRNLPYATLSDETALLVKAYEIYCKNEDCNVAYNDTLDLVVDEIADPAGVTCILGSSAKSTGFHCFNRWDCYRSLQHESGYPGGDYRSGHRLRNI